MRLTASLPPVAHGLLLATAVIWLLLELRQSTIRRSEAKNADKGSRLLLGLATWIGVAGADVITRVAPSAAIRPAGAAAWIGLAVLWCGVALRLWSIRTLGRYFTFTVQTSVDQPVITAGPYRVLRHPSYAGFLLAFMGAGLLIGNWWSLLWVTAAVTGGLVFRIHVEETALLRDVGNAYRSYAATRKRLVPFIW